MRQTRLSKQELSDSQMSDVDEEEGEAEQDEMKSTEPPFSKLLDAINSQLSILNEEQVTWISFDWHATDCYLKCSYNKATPIE